MATADTLIKPDFGAKKRHFIFTEEHEALRESIRAFVTKELAPHARLRPRRPSPSRSPPAASRRPAMAASATSCNHAKARRCSARSCAVSSEC